MKTNTLPFLATLLIFSLSLSWSQNGPEDTTWIHIWDGDNLDDWDIKIKGHDLNENWNNTFRSVDGDLVVDYSDYSNFSGEPFGHAGYKVRPFSFYMLRVEYQHWSDQVSGGPSWAYQNNGIMYHSQPVATMGPNQDFPVSMEGQLLGSGNRDADNNSNLNLCTPGTAFYNAASGGSRNNAHCTSATTNDRADVDEWAWATFLVLGDSIIRHYTGPSATGTPDFTYYRPVRATNSGANGVTINVVDNEPITEGYITIQSESHPYKFRTLDVVDLVGCMDESASNYKSYLVRHDESLCETGPRTGCTDENYEEYDSLAVEDDGSCETLGFTKFHLQIQKSLTFQASHGEWAIEVPGAEKYNLVVFDVQGREVFRYSGVGGKRQLFSPNLESGLYLYNIAFGSSITQGKVLVP